MKTIVSVLTSPLRTEYLSSTLSELDAAGAVEFERFIAVDGLTDKVPALRKWPAITVGAGRGTRAAMLQTIKHAAELGADQLLYFEDDLISCRNAVTAFAQLRLPDECGFLVGCDVRNLTKGLPQGEQKIVQAETLHPGFWGSHALQIPGRALRHLAGLELGPGQAFNASDVFIGSQLGSKAGRWKMFAVQQPSLFQHIGARSLCTPDEGLSAHRVAASFEREFDALALLEGAR